MLRSESRGALLLWPNQVGLGGMRYRPVRSDNLRRLHLVEQAGETLFFMMRPLATATDSPPAPLRQAWRRHWAESTSGS